MISPEMRMAAVYIRGGLVAIVSVDRNVAGHGIVRPEPNILSRKAASVIEIGNAVLFALASNHGNAPLRPWEDPNSPTLWNALGFKSEVTFLRGTVSVGVHQLDTRTAVAKPSSRRGATFSYLSHPGFKAQVNDPVAMGDAVLMALAEST